MATVVANSLIWGREKAFGTYTTTADDTVCWPITTGSTKHHSIRFDNIDATAGDATSRFAAGFPIAGALWDPIDKNATTDLANVVWDPGTGIVELIHASNNSVDGYIHLFEGSPIWHAGYARAGTPPSGSATMSPTQQPWQAERIHFPGANLAAEATVGKRGFKVGHHQVVEFSDVNANAGDTYQAAPGLSGAVWDPLDKSDDNDQLLVSWNSATGVVSLTSGADDAAAGYLHLFYGGAVVNF
jgi:hypothetical protein